jgi:ADP-heptose:LPS heptosyltransferase
MTLKVCPGIGDNIWLFMKLINSGMKFDFHIQDGNPRRSLPIFDMLPQLVNTAEYVEIKGGYKAIKAGNVARRGKLFADIPNREHFLSANEHLENGWKIENFLPDLKTSYRLLYDLKGAQSGLQPFKKYIGIYGSSYSTARAWGFWQADKWAELCKMIYKHNPEYRFVIIGADFDTDMNTELCNILLAANIPYINKTGRSLQETAAIIKDLHYFFAFPSGLPILAHTMDIPLTMFYPKHLSKMMNAWARPEYIESGFYKGCQFCEPDKIFDWTRKHGWI